MLRIIGTDPTTGWRVAENPSWAVQPVSPQLTTYVMAEIAARPLDDLFDFFFPRVNVDKILFNIGQTDGSELVAHDTKRAERARIRTADFGYSKVPAVTERRTFGTLLDEREIQNADPWDLAGRAALAARYVVEYDSISRMADILNDDDNFLGVIDVTAGAGWNQVGARTDIRTAIDALEAATGVPRTQMRVALFGDAYNGVRYDPTLAEARNFTKTPGVPTSDEIAAWLDVAQVRRFMALTKPSKEAPAEPLFPPHAVVFVRGDQADLASLSGGIAWGGHFVRLDGYARRPFFEEMETSFVYPWERDDLVRISKPGAAFLIKNPYQTAEA